ncbi:hypothetical protein OKW34_003166 [Paraburkholderia youngii]
MPHTLRSLRLADEPLGELTMLCGFDDDLAAQITQTRNGIRGLLTQIHPALERVLGPPLEHPAVRDLLQRYPSPAALAATSEKTLANRLTKLAPRMGKGLAAEIVRALGEQAVTVPGTQAATIVMPRLAQQLAALRKQRDEIAAEVERLVLAHPLWPVLTSMPGVGCHLPPYRGHRASGIKEPGRFRHKGATSFPAYRSQLVFGIRSQGRNRASRS